MQNDPRLIDKLHTQAMDLLSYLTDAQQPSFASFANDALRKLMLLAAASYFEQELSSCVIQYASDVLSEGHPLQALVRLRAVERQYHTWFDWKSANVNQFWSLFGESFKAYAKARVSADTTLREGIQAFLELGQARNLLVHENLAAYPLEKTSKEIYTSFVAARAFVDMVPELLRSFGSDVSA